MNQAICTVHLIAYFPACADTHILMSHWQCYGFVFMTSVYIYILNSATSRKVAGSIPDCVVGIIHWRNPSRHTMALGSTHTLTEMSTRNISWW